MVAPYTDYSSEVLLQMQLGAEYVVWYHALFFLQASIGCKAPGNDLRSFHISLKIMMDPTLQPRYGEIASALHGSLQRHLWYLVPQLICLAVADDDLEVEEKDKIVDKLLDFEYPNEFDKEMAEPVVPPTLTSQLSDFVSDQSYLLFHHLGWNINDILDLKKSGYHSESALYGKFRTQISQLEVTNVSAERHIRLIQDFIKSAHSEDKLQDTLQVVKKNREDYTKDMTKSTFVKSEL